MRWWCEFKRSSRSSSSTQAAGSKPRIVCPGKTCCGCVQPPPSRTKRKFQLTAAMPRLTPVICSRGARLGTVGDITSEIRAVVPEFSARPSIRSNGPRSFASGRFSSILAEGRTPGRSRHSMK